MAKGSFAWFEKRRKTDALNLAQEQMTKALNTATLLHKAVVSASEGKKQEAQVYIETLSKEEEEVDSLRRSAFKELTNVAVSMEFREDLMHLVKRLDVMADHVKDSSRSLSVILDAKVPSDIWTIMAKVAEALVQSAATLGNSIAELGTNPTEAKEMAKQVEEIESRIDHEYLETKKMFMKYSKQVDPATLMILNNMIEFMEQAADICADTADYIEALASEE